MFNQSLEPLNFKFFRLEFEFAARLDRLVYLQNSYRGIISNLSRAV